MNFQVGKNFVSLSKLFNEFDNGNNMILQEKIKKEADGYGPLAPAFIEGANFAIENQWISVDDDLPCNHDELFINDDKKETKTVLSIINGYIMMSRMYKPKRKWRWDSEEQPTHWMPIPELPKE